MADTIINGNKYRYFQNTNGSNGPFYRAFFKTEDERNEAMAGLTSLSLAKDVNIRYIGVTEEDLYTITPRATMGGYPLFIRAVSVNNLKEKTGGGRRTRRRRSTKRTRGRKSKKRESKRRKSSTKRKSKKRMRGGGGRNEIITATYPDDIHGDPQSHRFDMDKTTPEDFINKSYEYLVNAGHFTNEQVASGYIRENATIGNKNLHASMNDFSNRHMDMSFTILGGGESLVKSGLAKKNNKDNTEVGFSFLAIGGS
jgi:hypothetical protein